MDRNETIHLHNIVPWSRRDGDDSSQSLLPLIHPPLPAGGKPAMPARRASRSSLPISACISVLRSQMSQILRNELKALYQKKVNIATIGVQVRTTRPRMVWCCSVGVLEVISNPHRL